MPPAPSIVLDTVEKVRKLRHAVVHQDENDEDPALVVAACRALLEPGSGNATAASLNQSLLTEIYQLYIYALLQQSQFDRVLQIILDQNNKKLSLPVVVQDALLQPWHIYTLYRLERYAEAQTMALQALQNNNNYEHNTQRALQHLIAQCHFRLGNIAAATAAYETLLSPLLLLNIKS